MTNVSEIYPHYVKIDGIRTLRKHHYGNINLKSAYILEHFSDTPSTDAINIILVPGAYDPMKGAYSPATIKSLLGINYVGSVSELHFQWKGQSGYIEPINFSEDLNYLITNSGIPTIIIGTSASTSLMISALYEAALNDNVNYLNGMIMIGPYLPDYTNIMGAAIEKRNTSKASRRDITAHCGHPYASGNTERLRAWWDSSAK